MSENKILILLPMVMMVCTNAIAMEVAELNEDVYEMVAWQRINPEKLAVIRKANDVIANICAAKPEFEDVERLLMKRMERSERSYFKLLTLVALDLAANEDFSKKVTRKYRRWKYRRWKYSNRKKTRAYEIKLAKVRKVIGISVQLIAMRFDMKKIDRSYQNDEEVRETLGKVRSTLEEIDSMLAQLNRITGNLPG